jgi:hypothetical protein
MDILGRERQRIQQLAERVARRAAAIAGGAVPPAGRGAEESLLTIDAALSALAEVQENSARELRRLAAAGDRSRPPAPASPRSMLILAELRDRLRPLAAEPGAGDVGTGTLPWVIARLDEALADLEVREFADDGVVDVRRHQIVDRRPADVAHPPGTIARSVRAGLTLAGALLRSQQVVVYADQDREGHTSA